MGQRFDILNSNKNRVTLRHKTTRVVYSIERMSVTEYVLRTCTYESVYKRFYQDLGTYGSQIEAAMVLKSMANEIEAKAA